MSSLCLSNVVCQSPSSIRRTFSAEVLPQTNQNGFLSFKKADQDDDQIKLMKNSSCSNNGENREKKGAFDDIWSSIQKNVGSGTTTTDVYVHPLVKRSTSLLTQKSLEVCTESLGSETGSDTVLEQLQPNVSTIVDVEAEFEVVANWCTKLPSSRVSLSPEVVVPTIPPPMPSLSHREGSNNLQMRAHRKDGRLVVEAVAVPSVKTLCATRHHGRLLLTLNKNTDEVTTIVTAEEKTTSPSTLIISKLTELTNCRWPRNLNATIVRRAEDSDALNNAYECYWKNVGPLLGPGPQQNIKVGPIFSLEDAHNKGKLAHYNKNNNKEMKGEKEEEYENIIGGCKRRSSLLFWDSDKHPTSFYIATS